ncbi:hypothetical protein B0H19DRAFT_1246860 [Mycena capillaripes]|nr:hypothetical protein B0H19DRAFT_1246860 [Mycena capillaripes]
MALHAKTIENLCHDKKTSDEAKKLFQTARANTGVGSGFDLGEDRTGLAAVCAYEASQRLNNTNVTFEAAQLASCQSKAKFKRLHTQVVKALDTPKPAKRKPASFDMLLLDHCSKITRHALLFMNNVEALVTEKLEEDNKHDDITDDEITCAVFVWVCNVIEKQRLFHSKSFEEKYETDAANMRELNTIIKTVCGRDMEATIREDYTKAVEATKSASVSPRKSPTKPLRTLPSRDSPQKRKVAVPDAEEDLHTPDSPTKRRKVGQAASPSIATLDSIRTRSMTSSPVKPPPTPSTPRKAQRLPPSPSKTPAKTLVTRTPTRAVKLIPVATDDVSESSDEEHEPPPPRRRFRPVFRDQKQWATYDPRLAKLAEAALEFNKRMVERHGLPFRDWRKEEVESD